MPGPRPNLSHMGIFVGDLPKMEQFYTEALGLLVTDRGRPKMFPGELVFLSSNPDQHHQLVLASGRPAEATFSVVMQLSFTVAGLPELRAVKERAIECGATNVRTTNHGNAWSVYFKDPEGNTVEVYVDTPYYVAQPHADPLDLSKPDDLIVAETQALCRSDPTFMPREQWAANLRERLAKRQ